MKYLTLLPFAVVFIVSLHDSRSYATLPEQRSAVASEWTATVSACTEAMGHTRTQAMERIYLADCTRAADAKFNLK